VLIMRQSYHTRFDASITCEVIVFRTRVVYGSDKDRERPDGLAEQGGLEGMAIPPSEPFSQLFIRIWYTTVMEAIMDNLSALIDRYFAVWNEVDAERRRDLIARTWTEDAVYVDPLMEGAGQAGIDTMVAGVQAQFPGHTFRRTSEIDAHHDRVRFAWELAPEGGAALVRGVDFGLVVDDRLRSITGFLDQVPGQ
jgi:hypothetical protein